MSTYTQICYHIVFSTKHRTSVLTPDHRDELYHYIRSVIKGHKSTLYEINGIRDHIHILTSLHPTVCLADFVKDIKLASSDWIAENGAFPGFDRWQDGYGAFTCAFAERGRIAEYIRSQEEHHRRETPLEEMRRLLKDAGISFEERYLE
jgi:putative transposase